MWRSSPGSEGGGPLRWAWFGLGWISVVVGGIGVVVPGLPTTVFFVVAASCFARSSPRFERWILDLRGVGPLVRDHRAGLGMPRRAKRVAVTMIVVAVAASAVFGTENRVVAATIVAAGALGVWWVLARVPTRERVLAEGAADGSDTP